MQLLFYAHFTNILFSFGGGVLNLENFMLTRWFLVCVICNSREFSFLNIQTLHNYCSYIEHVPLLFVQIFRTVELIHFFHPKYLGGVCFV